MMLQSPNAVESSPLRLLQIDEPTIAPNEVLIRVAVCGLCHTDLHLVEGDIVPPHYPVIPGHQVVGVVQVAGAAVTQWKPGDRVGVPWLHQACGECRFCLRGQENLCEKIRFTGFHEHGGFAQWVKVREEFAYAIPGAFDDLHAAPLLCAGVIGYRALRLTGMEHGKHIGMYGFGASAHIALQIARHHGCAVSVFTRSDNHRRLAEELGAVWVGGSDQRPPLPLDSAVIFAPAGELVPRALGALDKGGTLTLAGIHMSKIPPMPYERLGGERVVRSVANSTREDVRNLLALATELNLKPEVHAFPLAEANIALQALKSSTVRGSGALTIDA